MNQAPQGMIFIVISDIGFHMRMYSIVSVILMVGGAG